MTSAISSLSTSRRSRASSLVSNFQFSCFVSADASRNRRDLSYLTRRSTSAESDHAEQGGKAECGHQVQADGEGTRGIAEGAQGVGDGDPAYVRKEIAEAARQAGVAKPEELD